MSDLTLIKFVNGDEAVAEVVNETELGVLIKRPMTLHLQQQEDGKVGANFIPMLIMSEGEVFVPNSAVMMHGKPAEQFERQYLQITSGIMLA